MSQEGEWTKERAEIAKAMFLAGNSNAVIAKFLNRRDGTKLTRNAVIGKLHRMKIKRNAPASIKAAYPKRTPSREPRLARRVVYRAAPPAPFEVTADSRLLVDLTRGDCRFPLGGEGSDTLFCGAPVREDGCSWCAGHARIVFQSPANAKASERKANWQARLFA